MSTFLTYIHDLLVLGILELYITTFLSTSTYIALTTRITRIIAISKTSSIPRIPSPPTACCNLCFEFLLHSVPHLGHQIVQVLYLLEPPDPLLPILHLLLPLSVLPLPHSLAPSVQSVHVPHVESEVIFPLLLGDRLVLREVVAAETHFEGGEGAAEVEAGREGGAGGNQG